MRHFDKMLSFSPFSPLNHQLVDETDDFFHATSAHGNTRLRLKYKLSPSSIPIYYANLFTESLIDDTIYSCFPRFYLWLYFKIQMTFPIICCATHHSPRSDLSYFFQSHSHMTLRPFFLLYLR